MELLAHELLPPNEVDTSKAVVHAHADVSTPAVLFQVGSYPFQHGSLGAIRSLGRMGVQTYLIAKNRLAPHGLSRYLHRKFRFDGLSTYDDAAILATLREIAGKIGRPAVLIPTDDEAAICVARLAASLGELYLLPQVPASLPGKLASKRGLYRECVALGIPAPATVYAQTRQEASDFSASAKFPIIIKNSEPWSRIVSPAVASTTIVQSLAEFAALSRTWRDDPKIVIQEYIPANVAQDWIVHMYCDRATAPLVAFSGRKFRSWPPGAGVTTLASAEKNDDLVTMAAAFCAAVGYSGIVDMDWRYDGRDKSYKLLDFNPRVGANFRLFETTDGIDVVRALYLDLTGQMVSRAPPDFRRNFCVENLDLISRLAASGKMAKMAAHGARLTEYAWFASDDPLPFLAMGLRFGGQCLRRLWHLASQAAISRPTMQSDVN